MADNMPIKNYGILADKTKARSPPTLQFVPFQKTTGGLSEGSGHTEVCGHLGNLPHLTVQFRDKFERINEKVVFKNKWNAFSFP